MGSSRADKRMKALQGDIQGNRRAADVVRTRDDRRKQIAQTLKAQNEALGKAKRKAPLQDQIYQAGMKIKARDWIRNLAIVGGVVVVICFLLQVPLYLCPVFGIAVAYLGGRFWLGFRRKRYQAAYLDELPNAVEAIVRGVKSGLPLNDSMRLVAKEAKEPIKSEFQRVLDQQALGKSSMEAVQLLFERMPLPEVNFFVVVITVQAQSGGNLSEALGNEAKASAGIIGSLPFIVGLLVTLTTPSYMVPLFTTEIGLIWLGIAAVLMGIGAFMMNRMIQFDF
jgi:tight adherence protein B